jgi:glycogen debranching enzyme
MSIMDCVEMAKAVIRKNTTNLGTFAGDYYPDLWCRDALISSLGMSKSKELMELAKRNIDSVAGFQKPVGQIPNKISARGDKVCFGEGGCVDSSLWYPIAALEYYKASKDEKFLFAHIYKIEKAIFWAHCLDVNNDHLIETNEGSDWMDMLIRSGRVLYDNALLYGAMNAADEIRKILGMEKKYQRYAENLKESFNLFFWPEKKDLDMVRKRFGFSGLDKDIEIALGAGERSYYLADSGFRRFDSRCDVFANTLAIIFDLADKEKTRKILDFFEREKVYEPYPVRVLTPPICDDDQFRSWHFRETELPYLQRPGNYHNGGVWPFAGGFYVAMMKKLGKNTKEIENRLIEANSLGENRFSEWISSFGEPCGSANQTWSAAMLIYAMRYKK